MNKSDLVTNMAQASGITKSAAEMALNAVTESITTALKNGDKLTLVGFGTFSVTKRSARTGRNPRTGKPLKIPAKKVVKFKAGAKLSNAVKK